MKEKEVESPYNTDFVAKVLQGDEDFKAGEGIQVDSKKSLQFMKIEYSEKAYKDLEYWLKSDNKKVQKIITPRRY